MTEQEVMQGLDYLTLLSYGRVDKSELPYEKKRDILYSMYCFRCVFDNEELKRVSNTLTKYGISFVSAKKPQGEGVVEITDKDRLVYKYDVGSPAYALAVKNGNITGSNAIMPQKLTLFELPLEIIATDDKNDELKAMWLIYFPYVILMGAPIEYDLFDKLKETVNNPGVFSAALQSKYSETIYCTREEMSGEHPLIADWYGPFIDWKNEKTEKGVSRITAFIQKKLALGDYDYVMRMSERLLDCFPDDRELLLLNIAGRMSACASVDFETRVKLLAENFRIINDALTLGKGEKYVYLLYYRGMTRLGMQDFDNARSDFNSCLEIDEHFEPAIMMLKGLDNAEKNCAKDGNCTGDCTKCGKKE